MMHSVRVTIAVASLGLVAAACSGIQMQTGIYQTLDEAREAGAIDRGWVPKGLPASASDIREGHLADGHIWGTFSFEPRDRAALESLVGAEITSGPVDCDPPGRLEWWPLILRSPIDLARVKQTGLRLYRGNDRGLTFAVNWGQGRGYYWAP
jgi:hypothetical protein